MRYSYARRRARARVAHQIRIPQPVTRDSCAQSTDRLAYWELEQMPINTNRELTLDAVVMGTVVFEAVLVTLRLVGAYPSRPRSASPSASGSMGRSRKR